jgi:hypothetical protein
MTYLICGAASAQGPSPKSVQTKQHGTDEQWLSFHANGRSIPIPSSTAPKLEKIGFGDVRDVLKNRARYLLLVVKKIKADGVNVMDVASVYPKLLEYLEDTGKINDATTVDE